jgi:hypothetical protein
MPGRIPTGKITNMRMEEWASVAFADTCTKFFFFYITFPFFPQTLTTLFPFPPRPFQRIPFFPRPLKDLYLFPQTLATIVPFFPRPLPHFSFSFPDPFILYPFLSHTITYFFLLLSHTFSFAIFSCLPCLIAPSL